ncbi:MAG: amidohydrolase family protein [Gemmatimonadota bacterium]
MVGRLVAPLLIVALGTSVASAQPGRGGGTPTNADGTCPAGMTEIRPRICQAPMQPAPSIVDYRPKSTLVTPAHSVPKAKFPAIDFHGHPQAFLSTAEGLDSLRKLMDHLNLGMMIAAENQTGDRLRNTLALVAANPKLKDRVRVLTGISFRDMTPGWTDRVVAQLEADVKAGAVGIGEIGKGFGLSTRKPDGSRLPIDDAELDPIWAAAARLKIPVFIHTADPERFFAPHDYANERWLEMALFNGRNYPADQYPSFEQLMTERNNLIKRNPRTTFVVAHMAWIANDLGRLGQLLDEMPNMYTEMGAVLYDIGRQPRVGHDFFVKYQDRILFGKDSFQPEEYRYYWRVFETADEYFDYYRDYHAFWKLYGIALPDSVLKKVYYANALKITPLAPRAAFPR